MTKLTVKVDKNYRGDKYLFVFMPDGTKLPRQTELYISDKTGSKSFMVKFQFGDLIDNPGIRFERGKYYFNGEIILGQKRVKKPLLVKPFPDDIDLFVRETSYFIGQFSCTNFDFE